METQVILFIFLLIDLLPKEFFHLKSLDVKRKTVLSCQLSLTVPQTSSFQIATS